MTMVVKKLVRDKIPEIMANNGEYPPFRMLSNEEHWEYLCKKYMEEFHELECATTESEIAESEITEELADIFDVLRAMAAYFNIEWDAVERTSNTESYRKGDFHMGVALLEEDNSVKERFDGE